MAKGLKIARANSVQIDQAIKPQQITYASSTNTNATVYVGGTGGFQSGTTSLVILVNYKMADTTAKSDGQIVKQKGSKTFLVQSAAGGAATLTRCTLVPSGTLAASQMYIKAVSPTGVAFYASRITDRFVWNGTTRYPYVLANTSALTYIDTTSGVTFTNPASGDEGAWAVVEGA